MRLTEGGSFLGGVAGGALDSSILTGPTLTTICAGLTVPSGGVALAVCGLVVVAVGSLGAGMAGGMSGEGIGDMIYEVSK